MREEARAVSGRSVSETGVEQHQHQQNKSIAWRPDGVYATHVWTCAVKGCAAIGKKDKAGPHPVEWFIPESRAEALEREVERLRQREVEASKGMSLLAGEIADLRDADRKARTDLETAKAALREIATHGAGAGFIAQQALARLERAEGEG